MTDTVEIVDARELAQRWSVPESWVRNHSRQGFANDPIPHAKLGRYTRYEWGSPQLTAWWRRRTSGKSK
jgi:hypothetical protein